MVSNKNKREWRNAVYSKGSGIKAGIKAMGPPPTDWDGVFDAMESEFEKIQGKLKVVIDAVYGQPTTKPVVDGLIKVWLHNKARRGA